MNYMDLLPIFAILIGSKFLREEADGSSAAMIESLREAPDSSSIRLDIYCEEGMTDRLMDELRKARL